MDHENSVVGRERLLRRLELCKTELKRAKQAISFWSKELSLVVDAISDDKQFDFSEVWSKDSN